MEDSPQSSLLLKKIRAPRLVLSPKCSLGPYSTHTLEITGKACKELPVCNSVQFSNYSLCEQGPVG